MIDEFSRFCQNVDHFLIQINELIVLHLEMKAFINTKGRFDDIPAPFFKALEVWVSTIITFQEGKKNLRRPQTKPTRQSNPHQSILASRRGRGCETKGLREIVNIRNLKRKIH
jgi:hypothetical protein